MMRARTLIVAALAALAAALPGAAAASPAAQAETDRIAAVASDLLHAPVPTRTLAAPEPVVVEFLANERRAWDAYVMDGPDVYVRPWVVGALERRTCTAAALMLHELLHRPEVGTEDAVEEGIAEALRLDLYPAVAKRLGCRGWRTLIGTLPMYPAEVSDVMTSSVYATGSRRYSDRAARLWRRELWAASRDGRRDMLAAAAAARDAKGGAR